MEKRTFYTGELLTDHEFLAILEDKFNELELGRDKFENGFIINIMSNKFMYWEDVKIKLEKLLADINKSFGHFEYLVFAYPQNVMDYGLRMFLVFDKPIESLELGVGIMNLWHDVCDFKIRRFKMYNEIETEMCKVEEIVNAVTRGEYTPYVKWCDVFLQSENFIKERVEEEVNYGSNQVKV